MTSSTEHQVAAAEAAARQFVQAAAAAEAQAAAQGAEAEARAQPGLAYRPVPPGVIEVERADDQRWLEAIGRDRGVKRFGLTRGEAPELVRVLRRRVLTLDSGEPS
jgi:hypothetical protein